MTWRKYAAPKQVKEWQFVFLLMIVGEISIYKKGKTNRKKTTKNIRHEKV